MSSNNSPNRDFFDRLEIIIQNVGHGKVSNIASTLKMHPTTLKRYLEGREPKIGLISALHKAYNISPNWLLLGIGNMYFDEKNTNGRFANTINEWATSLIDAGTHTEDGLLYDFRINDKRFDNWLTKKERKKEQNHQSGFHKQEAA
ncbi:MAG: hypothetical protein OCC45_06410 [Desulfotalea sp.]